MKHKDYRAEYNEIMYDERDQIQKFLERQADTRYGNQMYEWTLEPMPELISSNGLRVKVREIVLDKNDFVLFRVCPFNDGRMEEWKCYDFALGELEKVLDALPEVDDIIYKCAEDDLTALCRQCENDTIDLEEIPFSWKQGKSTFFIHTVFIDKSTGKVSYEIREDIEGAPNCDKNWGIWEDGIPAEQARLLVNRLTRAFLNESSEYKRLRELLNGYVRDKNDANSFCWSIDNIPSVSINISDVEYAVNDVFIGQGGDIRIHTSPVDSRIGDEFTFTEYELKPDMLKPIIEAIEKFLKRGDIQKRISLTDEQKALVAQYHELVAKMCKASIGYVRNDNSDTLYFINMKEVKEIACDRNLSSKQMQDDGWHEVLKYLDGPHPNPLDEMYFYGSDGETIMVQFTD